MGAFRARAGMTVCLAAEGMVSLAREATGWWCLVDGAGQVVALAPDRDGTPRGWRRVEGGWERTGRRPP